MRPGRRSGAADRSPRPHRARAWPGRASAPGWSAPAPSRCSRTIPPRGRRKAEPPRASAASGGLLRSPARRRPRPRLVPGQPRHARPASRSSGASDAWSRSCDAARDFGARMVNVHVGSHKGSGTAAGIERVGEALAIILDRRAAGRRGADAGAGGLRRAGRQRGVTIAELGAILDAAARHGADRSRLGICLDTAHLWGAGYALDAPDAVDALLAQADEVLGPGGLAMLHLNDSRVRRGSRFGSPRAHRRRRHRSGRPAAAGDASSTGRRAHRTSRPRAWTPAGTP